MDTILLLAQGIWFLFVFALFCFAVYIVYDWGLTYIHNRRRRQILERKERPYEE